MSRINWTAIKQRITENDTLLFVLDRHWQQLLLSVVENFTWTATFKTAGYDYSDWDDLQRVVAKGTDDLMGGVMLADIIGYIDEIEALLRLIENKSGCCPPEGTTTYFPAPDMGDPEYTKDGETYPLIYAGITMDDAEMYHLYLCGAANQMIDNWIAGMSQLENQMIAGIATVGALAVLIATFSTFGLIVPVGLGALALAFAALSEFWEVDVFVTASDDLEAARDQLICAILDGDSAALEALVEDTVSAAAWAAFLQWQNYQNMISTVFSGQVDGDYITVTPTAQVCSECELTYDFDETFTFDSDAESFTGSKGGWVSDFGGCLRCVPDGGGYTYLDYHEEDILTRLGLPTNTYLQIEAFDIVLHRTNVTIGGTPTFSVTAFADSGNEGYSVQCSNITTNTEGELVHWSPATPGTVYCQTPNQVNGFIRIHCQQGGAALPVVYVHSLRVRGWVNP